jgi:plastocyanin
VPRLHSLRAAVAAVALAIAVGGAVHAAGKAEPKPEPRTVTIDAVTYAPRFVTVHPGETITWVNKDLVAHTVTAKNGSFDSKVIEAGKSWSFTPKERGQFDYKCTLHPTMKGTLVVR